MSAVGDIVPTGIMCDIIEPNGQDKCNLPSDGEDFGKLLSKHKKAVVFALPGAFTPTCSVQHLPGFIKHSEALKAKGVDAIYCILVNDKFVSKSWADSTEGFNTSGVSLVADGSCEYTKALNQVLDLSGGRLGLRSQRYAMIVESGKITSFNIDTDFHVQEKSSAEYVLSIL